MANQWTNVDMSIGRVGLIRINNDGQRMEVIHYESAKSIIVLFDDGSEKNCRIADFKKGAVRSNYFKSVYGIGYSSEGKYIKTLNGINTKNYNAWRAMLDRCYGIHSNHNYVYKNCTVCEEWHNFQNFAEWFDDNYYNIEGEKMNLDKDILIKGNKIYSPETCIYCPHHINSIILNAKKKRGLYPIGVTYEERLGKFRSRYTKNGKRIHLGVF